VSALKAVNARLNAALGVTALVGTRIWAGRLGNETLPATRAAVVGRAQDHLMGADSGVVRQRVQVDSFDDDGAGCEALAAAVYAALNRQPGTYGGVVVQDIALENEFGVYEDEASIAGSRVYRVTQDYFVWWEE
jgi:hypothetical protein